MDITAKNIKKIINNVGKEGAKSYKEGFINLIMDGVGFDKTKEFSKSKFLKRLTELGEDISENQMSNYMVSASTVTIYLRSLREPRRYYQTLSVPTRKFFDYGCTIKAYDPIQLADKVSLFRKEYVKNYFEIDNMIHGIFTKVNMLREPTATIAREYIREKYGVKVEPLLRPLFEDDAGYVVFPICSIDTQWRIPIRTSEAEIKKIIDNTVKEWRQLTKFKYIHHERALIDTVKQTLAFLEEHKNATAISANTAG